MRQDMNFGDSKFNIEPNGDFEQRLRSLRPAAATIDRERLMYLAGSQNAAAVAARARRPWMISTAALVLLSVTQLSFTLSGVMSNNSLNEQTIAQPTPGNNAVELVVTPEIQATPATDNDVAIAGTQTPETKKIDTDSEKPTLGAPLLRALLPSFALASNSNSDYLRTRDEMLAGREPWDDSDFSSEDDTTNDDVAGSGLDSSLEQSSRPATTAQELMRQWLEQQQPPPQI